MEINLITALANLRWFCDTYGIKNCEVQFNSEDVAKIIDTIPFPYKFLIDNLDDFMVSGIKVKFKNT